MSRELLLQRTKTQSIPALKADDGSWVHEPTGKTNLFAKAFSCKSVLPVAAVNDYTTVQQISRQQTLKSIWSERDACKTLEELDVDSGTGPSSADSEILHAGTGCTSAEISGANLENWQMARQLASTLDCANI